MLVQGHVRSHVPDATVLLRFSSEHNNLRTLRSLSTCPALISTCRQLTIIEVLLVGGAEIYRNTEQNIQKRQYPGGVFDPLGLASGSDERAFNLKTAELKHGRLAMIAFLGECHPAEPHQCRSSTPAHPEAALELARGWRHAACLRPL